MTLAERVPFREFLRPNSRPYTLAPDQDANLVGMRWYGGGPFHRELKLAHKIQKKSHFAIKSGDVIYNKLFAWKGAFGLVSDELDGMFVSDKFPTYQLDLSRVEPRFLTWFFRHHDVWEQARRRSTGSAAISKLTLNPPQFLELEIPLPSLDEQKALADHLDSCACRIDEAKALRADTLRKIGWIVQSASSSLLSPYHAESQLGTVLLGMPRNGWSPKCDNLDDGTPVLTLSAVTGWHYNSTAYKRTSLPTDKGAHYWLNKGDLLITRSNTPELVGHAAIYDGHPYPCIYPDLIMKLRIDPAKASTKFVWWWMQTRPVRDYIARHAKGTSPTMKKISQPVVAGIPFPSSISLREQKHLVEELDALQMKVAAVKHHQIETGAALDTMLPAILDRAFDGGLGV